MSSSRISFVAGFALLALSACAKKAGPLPGDSVDADGGVTLSPARMSTTPRDTREAHDAREALGPIESRVFPPELVMDHQGELGIDPKQRDAIITEVQRSQAEMVRLQWELQGEKEKLTKVLDTDHVDEGACKEATTRLLDKESRVKAANLAMLVRVKNVLTPAQQKQLRELRASRGSGDVSSVDAGAVPH